MGRALSKLSKHRETSANPKGFLCSVPANITSSIFPPRRVLALCSPSTHLIASEILLLPLPFGPTTAVIPELNSRTIFSANDLKPCTSSLFKCNYNTSIFKISIDVLSKVHYNNYFNTILCLIKKKQMDHLLYIKFQINFFKQ